MFQEQSKGWRSSFLAYLFSVMLTLFYLNLLFIASCIIFDRDKHLNLHLKAAGEASKATRRFSSS